MHLIDTTELRRRGLGNEADAADAAEEPGGYRPPTMPPAVVTMPDAERRAGALAGDRTTLAPVSASGSEDAPGGASSHASHDAAPSAGMVASVSSAHSAAPSVESVDSALLSPAARDLLSRAETVGNKPPPLDVSRTAQDARIEALNGELPSWARNNPAFDPTLIQAAESALAGIPVQVRTQALDYAPTQASTPPPHARATELER